MSATAKEAAAIPRIFFVVDFAGRAVLRGGRGVRGVREEHTVAVGESGDVFSWGWGEAGRLGIGEVGKTLVPTRVNKFLGVGKSANGVGGSSKSSGYSGSSGSGAGGGGAGGGGGGREEAPTTRVIARGVACGREHTLILTVDGMVFACGPGYGGRLGLGPGSKDVLVPTCVNTAGNDLEYVAAADDDAC